MPHIIAAAQLKSSSGPSQYSSFKNRFLVQNNSPTAFHATYQTANSSIKVHKRSAFRKRSLSPITSFICRVIDTQSIEIKTTLQLHPFISWVLHKTRRWCRSETNLQILGVRKITKVFGQSEVETMGRSESDNDIVDIGNRTNWKAP